MKEERIITFVMMLLTGKDKAFMQEHQADDLTRLLLSAARYPEVNVPWIVDQLMSRRQIREKLPSWYANPDLIFPARITTEQASSEQTAAYKQRFVSASDHVCDLTGGLGIDSCSFAGKARRVTYIERFADYCEAARHNFAVLGADNIEVLQGDSRQLIDTVGGAGLFYIDPARRGESNQRVFALSDCEPDLTQLLPELLTKAPRILAKLSPMADITQVTGQLQGVKEVHVLSVENECKELLFLIRRGEDAEPVIHCVNLQQGYPSEPFVFTAKAEHDTESCVADGVGAYIYEPNTSILKAGAFKQVGIQCGVKKLAVSSHLYTSDQLMADFPGRRFQVAEVIPFHSKLIKTISQDIPKANITTRNFPLSVAELRTRTKIKDGGNVYLFATILSDGEKVLIKCHK